MKLTIENGLKPGEFFVSSEDSPIYVLNNARTFLEHIADRFGLNVKVHLSTGVKKPRAEAEEVAK